MKKVWEILAFMIAANILLVAYTAQRRIKLGESILKDGYALFSENESINLSYFAETVGGETKYGFVSDRISGKYVQK